MIAYELNVHGELIADTDVYTSILDVPLDKWSGLDAVDFDREKPRRKTQSAAQEVSKFASIAPTAPKRVVVFPRTISLNDFGPDVLALKRALSRAKFRKWDASTNKFGATLEKNVKAFQKDRGLEVDGVYGYQTHLKLKQYFDLYGASLMLKEQNLLNPRNIIVNAAIVGYNNRERIYYTQGSSRMYGVRNKIYPPGYPLWEDCSSFATWTYFCAGAADPNGFGYNGLGYTGTLSAHGTRVTTARPGDLAFYGPGWPFGHVTVCISSDRCISHGSNAGPELLPIRYRSDYYYTRSYLS